MGIHTLLNTMFLVPSIILVILFLVYTPFLYSQYAMHYAITMISLAQAKTDQYFYFALCCKMFQIAQYAFAISLAQIKFIEAYIASFYCY